MKGLRNCVLVSCLLFWVYTSQYVILKSRKHRINTHDFLNCTHNILFYCYHTALNLYKLLFFQFTFCMQHIAILCSVKWIFVGYFSISLNIMNNISNIYLLSFVYFIYLKAINNLGEYCKITHLIFYVNCANINETWGLF